MQQQIPRPRLFRQIGEWSPKVYPRDSGVLHWLLGIDSVRLDFLSVIREVMRWKP